MKIGFNTEPITFTVEDRRLLWHTIIVTTISAMK